MNKLATLAFGATLLATPALADTLKIGDRVPLRNSVELVFTGSTPSDKYSPGYCHVNMTKPSGENAGHFVMKINSTTTTQGQTLECNENSLNVK
jgi:hypothetical protein